MRRLPPALAAAATLRILELLGRPPATVLELGFGAIHATPLRLAGFEVVVVDTDVELARERAGDPVYDEVPRRSFHAVIAPEGTDLSGVQAERVLTVKADGTVLG